MKNFIAILNKLHLHRIFTVVFAALLIIVTAFSSSPSYAQGFEQANLQLIATTNRDSELLYPGAETPQGRAYKESELPIKTEKNIETSQPGGLNQRDPNIKERVQNRLETVKGAVDEASAFLKDKADEASQRPELQKNPALGK